MSLTLRFDGDTFFFDDGTDERRQHCTESDSAAFEQWAAAYAQAQLSRNRTTFLGIGRELFAWLEDKGHWGQRLLDGTGPIHLTFQVTKADKPAQRAFLSVPWELLATQDGHLAANAVRPFCPVRRIGAPGAPVLPRHSDLFLMFMAAAPRGADNLNYESEEASILDATKAAAVHLAVEESGCLEFLPQRIALDAPIEALHLSCHGNIGDDGVSYLITEDPGGDPVKTTAAELVRCLGQTPPPLVFLSACRTAESEGQAVPLSIDLVGAGVPIVLGWDGAVYDRDATRFAGTFYGELARGGTPDYAAGVARQELLRILQSEPDKGGDHWHLARVFLGPTGGGSIAAPGKGKRPQRRNVGYQAFLDKDRQQVPVAPPETFVGRRREAQAILREFATGTSAGVLIHGMGAMGKSSLAARVANRLPHHRTAVVFGAYDALAIFNVVEKALPPRAGQDWRGSWLDIVKNDEAALESALVEALEGPAAVGNKAEGQHLILLVVDDLERILEDPAPGRDLTPFKVKKGGAVQAVIAAFDRAQTASRLLITSRYRFTAPDAMGRDLGDRLYSLPLKPMSAREQEKQQQAELRDVALPADVDDARLLGRAIAAAAGNPGLQSVLTRPIGEDPNAAGAAIAAVEHLRETGEIPDDGDLGDFFKRVALSTYRDGLDGNDQTLLRAAGFFQVPVPRLVLVLAGETLGATQVDRAIERSLGLGLIDAYMFERAAGEAELGLNALMRPLIDAVTEGEGAALSRAVTRPLFDAWKDDEGDVTEFTRALDLFRIAAVTDAELEVLQNTGYWAARDLFRRQHNAKHAFLLINHVVAALTRGDRMVQSNLIILGFDVANRLGDRAAQHLLQELGLKHLNDDDPDAASILRRQGLLLASQGKPDEALEWLNRAKASFEEKGLEKDATVTLGDIADILQARGQLDQALKIRQEEQLPVFDSLGDVRSRAVTLGQIADILQARGQLDQALKIRQEEQLPVFDSLGDVRSRAVTLGKIADILFARGQLDQALKIRQEEQLPVFDSLGDVRERAVTLGQIADILQARGQLDQALKIRQEEQLPVYDSLGDVRSRAVTLGQIADILQARGQLDQALKIRQEEQLPVFDSLGDVRERAVTLGKIADILQARGQLDQALKIRQEEQLPVFDSLGDVRERAVTLGQIADILFARGQLDQALKIRQEEQLPVFDSLGDVRSRAVTLGQIADILQARGQLDQALKIRQEEQLPVFDSLGDVRSRAVTLGKIADILQARGQLDQALKIRQEEQLPVFDSLGDVRERAVTLGQIADILQARGQLDQALKIRQEEQLPVYDSLGDVRERAVTLGKIADILQARGQLDQALEIFQDELLPVFENLGNVQQKAVVFGRIADILQARGQLDQALKIRQEEQLPVFDSLGDVRERAVTLGKIADILQARGQLDDAITLYLNEVIPVSERLGDIDGLAHDKFKVARLRIAMGIEDVDTARLVLTDLSEAFGHAVQLDRPDFIAIIGSELGGFLHAVGLGAEALSVYEQALAAYRRMEGQDDTIAALETTIATLRAERAAEDDASPTDSA